MIVVLDASAAIKIILNHTSAKGFSDVLKKSDWVIAPDIFVSEVTNAFWKYHLKYLNLSGYPLSSAKIVRYAFAELLDIVLNPKRAIELAWKKLFAN